MNINGKWLSEPEIKSYISKLEGLLKELQPVLGRAFFANFNDQDKLDELRDRITEVVGKERE